VLAHTILAAHDVLKLWGDLLNSKSDDVRLRCLCYLTDREQGKATQPTELTGALLVQQGDVAERIRQLEKELGYSAPAGNLPLIQPSNPPAVLAPAQCAATATTAPAQTGVHPAWRVP